MEPKLPNPSRYTDPTYGLLSKVFIVYPHNPRVYAWTPPTPLEELQRRYPELSSNDLKRMQVQEVKQNQAREREEIQGHDELVYRFAQFLDSHKIAVAYEGLLMDYPVDNYMKWFQKQMEDSDYIILIITDSFNHFLSNEPPEGKEHIFVGNFLHVLVHNPRKPILPVFLNHLARPSLLPDALRASTTYHVVASRDPPYFDVQQPQLDRLYAVLTKQNRITPPVPVGVVPVVSGLQRRVPIRTVAPRSNDEKHKQMYERLKRIRSQLTEHQMAYLSQMPGFCAQWRLLAERLGLAAAEVERANEAGHEDAERCFQLLLRWDRTRGQEATVVALAEAVNGLPNKVMLELAFDVLHES